MKILNLSYRSSPGYTDTAAWIGSYSFFYRIWEEVAKQHEVIFLEFIDAEKEVKEAGIQYQFLRKSKRSLLLPFRLNRFIAAQQPDVVVVHGLMYPLQVLLLRSALGKKTKIIVQHHAEKPLQSWRRILQPFADRVVDRYWFTAQGLADMWLQAGLIGEKKKVFELMETTSVFNVIPKEKAVAFTQMQGAPNYLWVGRLNDNKDPLLLIKTFLDFAVVHQEAHLYMIFGTDDLLSSVQDLLSQQPQAAGAIHLIGKVPHEELLHWYNSADFIVSCSHYEGSGVAICEAMSCACIPLVSDIPSFNYMTGKACGINFAPGDAEGLAAVLEASIAMDIKKEKEKTLQQYDEKLSSKAIASRIDELLNC